MRTFQKIFAVLTILALSTCIINSAYAQPETHFQSANNAIEGAFSAILDAEKAGADVTNLLSQLTDASDLLVNAENAYRNNDAVAAAQDENAIYSITQYVTQQAQEAKETALSEASTAFWLNIVLTAAAAIVFAVVTLLSWRFFKRYYIKNIANAKP
jgi:hypothetical protein